MLATIRSVIKRSWPIVGSLYLVYLAVQPPPSRWVGIGGLVVVTPLLVGWILGWAFGVGPWADGENGDADETDGDGPVT